MSLESKTLLIRGLFIVLLCETGSCYVTQVGLKLSTLQVPMHGVELLHLTYNYTHPVQNCLL